MILKNTTVSSILNAVEKLSIQSGQVLMILFAEKQLPDIKGLIDDLNKKNIIFFGGIFPGIIYGKEKMESGVILQTMQAADAPLLIKNISNKKLYELEQYKIATTKDYARTGITLIDGLTSNINYCLENLNNKLGEHFNFLGGGAGSLSLEQKPCVFSNEGFFEDAAVFCGVENKSKIGVRHGWKKLAGPVVATKTDGNKILQLNWQNPFEVYRHYVEADCQEVILRENFFNISKRYPFGIYREGDEEIVRDPISVGENDALICVGEVPTNTVLNILKGEHSRLIDSASVAARLSLPEEGEEIEQVFVIDCISRTLYLENQFEAELEAIYNCYKKININPIGILSLGEISTWGKGLLEFYNKTIVVGSILK